MDKKNIVTLSARPDTNRYFHVKNFKSTLLTADSEQADIMIEMGATEVNHSLYEKIKDAYSKDDLSAVTALTSAKSENKRTA